MQVSIQSLLSYGKPMFWRNRERLIFILPLTIILGIIVFGVSKTLFMSLESEGTLSLANYIKVISDVEFKNAIIFSLKTAFIATLISLVLGLSFAMFLKRSKSKIIIKLLNVMPIFLPHLIVAMLIIVIFSQTGIISRLAYLFNFIDSSKEFIELVNDKHGIGVILVYVYKEFPFVAIVIYGIIISINEKELLIAKSLKASNFQIFSKIIFPKVLPMLLALFMVLFIYSFSAYEIPSILGTSQTKALPVYIYYNYSNVMLGTKSYAMALNFIVILISFLFALIIGLILNKIQRNHK